MYLLSFGLCTLAAFRPVPVSSSAGLHERGTPLSSSCVGKEDGDYWLLLSSDDASYSPVEIRCSNEYMILNVAKDENLKDYFSSFEMFHHSVGGPANHDPVNWEEWFLSTESTKYNANSDYLISPDCNTCEEEAVRQVHSRQTTYWMTGNLAKLHWFVIGFNECDMDYETYTCYNCESCMIISGACDPVAYEETETDFSFAGICGVAVYESNKDVYKKRELAQGEGVRSYKPSTGTNGEFCVCYKPETSFEFELTEAQEDVIAQAQTHEAREEKVKLAQLGKKKKMEATVDRRQTRRVYLDQTDFEGGTYRITESGTYVITEDIIFNFNPNDDYWPRADQADEYIGADSYRDAYHLGFFAGITVECDYVTIDLNGKELKMDVEFYFMQRWFATIELSNQQFLPGQGPSFFGNDPKEISNVVIKNGILGLTSHFAIHGNFASNIEVTDVHIRDFVTHGMQLNGWENLVMKNVEIGPSSSYEYLRGDFGHARIISQRLRKLEKIDDLEAKRTKLMNHDEPLSLGDVADELEAQMGLALEYALNRISGKHAESDYIGTIDVLNDEDAKDQWARAKDQFVHESGFPSSSSVTGLFLNFEGASVFSYTMYTERQSSNGVLDNVYIHDITHDMEENVRFMFVGSGVQNYPTPWASDFPAERALGSRDRVLELSNYLSNFDDSGVTTNIDSDEFGYTGSALTDAYLVMGYIASDEWDYLGLQQIRQLLDGRTDIWDWATGDKTPQSDWLFGCNQDIMAHSGKGLLGLRIDGVDNLELRNVRIANLKQLSGLGTDACGSYKSFNAYEGGGHMKQNLPMQTGFSGNDLQGVSIIASTNVVLGDVQINDLYNDFSQAVALSMWTGNEVSVAHDGLIKIFNVEGGKMLEQGRFSYESLPNRSPEGCAVRMETSDEATYYDSTFTVNNDGTDNIVACNVKGHEMCLGETERTMWGTHYESLSVCESVASVSDLIKFREPASLKAVQGVRGKVGSVGVESVVSGKLMTYGGMLVVSVVVSVALLLTMRTGYEDIAEKRQKSASWYGAI